MILIYTVLIVLYLTFDGDLTDSKMLTTLYAIEIALLCLFVIDIVMQVYAFRIMYVLEPWNIADMVVIVLMLVFVLLDIFSTNQALKGFLKLRAVFRLLRVFLLVRKLNALRRIRETD